MGRSWLKGRSHGSRHGRINYVLLIGAGKEQRAKGESDFEIKEERQRWRELEQACEGGKVQWSGPETARHPGALGQRSQCADRGTHKPPWELEVRRTLAWLTHGPLTLDSSTLPRMLWVTPSPHPVPAPLDQAERTQTPAFHCLAPPFLPSPTTAIVKLGTLRL